ncbi:mediator of RNA polymerase II transcription subunit 11 isoform X1 [Eulemur rufifrons]|uniref:mediator of RNA polymerase II transcription subunit 11 isoform X1 n=1 Tax=Eulemur rufifrons TaxID=859984 RepID=UPI00374418EE
MATYSLANERLRALEDIEREIGAILQNAGSRCNNGSAGSDSEAKLRRHAGIGDLEQGWGGILSTVILELSKEKTNERLLDRQAAAFTASVQHVEAELSAQIRYLTQVATGQPHEGSSYSSRKDCQMALKRVDYARLKLSDVARTCEQMLEN